MEQVLEIITSLIGTIAVINLVALLLQGAKHLATVRGDNNKWARAVFLGVVGGLFGIYATYSGYTMNNGAIITIRDVGPMMAGCLGGPLGGLIAGVIAGLFRLLQGVNDITAGTTIPCSVSTLLIGISCGFLFKIFDKWKKRGLWAFGLGFVMQILHLVIVFFYKSGMDGFNAGWKLMGEVALPYLFSNAVAFAIMVITLDMIARYKETEKNEKIIESELNIATNIQSAMLPTIFPDFPGRKEMNLYALMSPAKEVGGDFYDFFFVDDDHFAFLIADVSGKGVPAALFMVISKTILKNNLQSGMPLAEAIEKSNNQLLDGNNEHMFVTAWIGILELSTGRLQYVNAGHNPPAIKKMNCQFEYLRKFSGFILAGKKDTKYKAYETYLYDGEKLLLYTDGVTEAMNTKKEQYGEDRLADFLNSSGNIVGTQNLISKLKANVTEFENGEEQSDDITILALRMSGNFETITVNAEMSKYDELMKFAEEQFNKREISEAIKQQLFIVFDEIFSNICQYSQSENVLFGISKYDGVVSMIFRYQGVEFDITKAKVPDITLKAEDRPIGGLGLFIVNKIMDQVNYRYENGENILILKKHIEAKDKEAE